MNLYEKTVHLVNLDRGNWPKTADDLDISRDWLSKLARGLIQNPGVNTIEKVYGYLSQRYPDAFKQNEVA